MIYVVTTTEGALLADKVAGSPFTQEEAEARCAQANKDAEALEIKTRYEVREQ